MSSSIKNQYFGHRSVHHARAGCNRHHAPQYCKYEIPEGDNLKEAAAFAYSDISRRTPKKKRQQPIELHSNNKDPSDAKAEWPGSEEGQSSECGSEKSQLGDRDAGTTDVHILED